MIQLKDVTFGYTKIAPVFKDLNLELAGGHIYGLLGKNGVGKTTLMKIIAGLRFADSGTTEVFGEPSYKRSPDMLQDLYYLAEEVYAPQLTIQQYVDAFAPFYPHFSREQMDAYLEQFELTGCTQRISAMSHGQKKKVIISFALASSILAGDARGVLLHCFLDSEGVAALQHGGDEQFLQFLGFLLVHKRFGIGDRDIDLHFAVVAVAQRERQRIGLFETAKCHRGFIAVGIATLAAAAARSHGQ